MLIFVLDFEKYSELSSGPLIPAKRDVLFSAVGTLGSVTYNCMALPIGYILDKYGTFKARSIGLGLSIHFS